MHCNALRLCILPPPQPADSKIAPEKNLLPQPNILVFYNLESDVCVCVCLTLSAFFFFLPAIVILELMRK